LPRRGRLRSSSANEQPIENWSGQRSTFLINGDGQVVREWRKVKVPGHVEAVLEAIKEL